MKVLPGRRAGAVRNAGQILLVPVLVAWKPAVGIDNSVAVSVNLLFKQPRKHPAAVRLLNPSIVSKTKLEPGPVGEGSLPMIADLAIPDKRPLVLAKIDRKSVV